MNVTGFSHITLNVRNLQTSLEFYHGILGMTLRHRGRSDAYLEWGSAWVCLVERADAEEHTDGFAGMDHVAFISQRTISRKLWASCITTMYQL